MKKLIWHILVLCLLCEIGSYACTQKSLKMFVENGSNINEYRVVNLSVDNYKYTYTLSFKKSLQGKILSFQKIVVRTLNNFEDQQAKKIESFFLTDSDHQCSENKEYMLRDLWYVVDGMVWGFVSEKRDNSKGLEYDSLEFFLNASSHVPSRKNAK